MLRNPERHSVLSSHEKDRALRMPSSSSPQKNSIFLVDSLPRTFLSAGNVFSLFSIVCFHLFSGFQRRLSKARSVSCSRTRSISGRYYSAVSEFPPWLLPVVRKRAVFLRFKFAAFSAICKQTISRH